jgi:diguanylate cyclase (GGDEF)-like protein
MTENVESAPVPERATRPLSQRFTYRYALALLGFVGLAVVTLVSFNRTLDRVDEATDQLTAVAEQSARVQRIAGHAHVLTTAQAVTDGIDQRQRLEGSRSDLRDELAAFRATQLGLLEGTGATGMAGPNRELEAFWNDPEAERAEVLWDFHRTATELESLVDIPSDDGGAGEEDPGAEAGDPADDRIGLANDFVQSTATPGGGSVALFMDDAVTAYSERLDSVVNRQRELDQILVAATIAMALLALFGLFRPMAQRIQLETTALAEAERTQRENNERQVFRNQLVRGLERASSEEEIFDRVSAALLAGVEDRPAELLLADSTNAHLREVSAHPDKGSPQCPVDDPSDCVAIARGQTMRFETSRALDVCPKLPRHAQAPCSAVCAPVRFLGQPLGVLHVTGPDLLPPDHSLVERVNVIADEAGSRLGMLRATRETRLQASTDGLTGLANRRSLEATAEELIASNRPFALAIADLDHFKELNDTYGHEAGDRALRLFARTLRSNLRPDDVASRYGGEEFVLLLPATSVNEARRALDRLRVTLAGDIAAAGIPPFTASWGLGTSQSGDTFGEMMQLADEALYAAKRAGRNRVVTVGDDPDDPRPPDDQIVLADDGTATRVSGVLTCGGCGLPNPRGSHYCIRCGVGLASSDEPSDSDSDPKTEGGADGSQHR